MGEVCFPDLGGMDCLKSFPVAESSRNYSSMDDHGSCDIPQLHILMHPLVTTHIFKILRLTYSTDTTFTTVVNIVTCDLLCILCVMGYGECYCRICRVKLFARFT